MRPQKYLEEPFSLIKVLQKTALSVFLVMLAGITYLSLTPISPTVSTLCWDKLNHLAAYLCLGILADIAFLTGARQGLKLCLLLIYSVFIEMAQHFIPNREFSVFDIFANTLGLMLAYGLLRTLQKTTLYHSFKNQ